jgi:hypothetical protein
MQRLSVINEVKGSFKEAEKDLDLKNKALGLKMQELSDKYLLFYLESIKHCKSTLLILKNTKFMKDYQN